VPYGVGLSVTGQCGLHVGVLPVTAGTGHRGIELHAERFTARVLRVLGVRCPSFEAGATLDSDRKMYAAAESIWIWGLASGKRGAGGGENSENERTPDARCRAGEFLEASECAWRCPF